MKCQQSIADGSLLLIAYTIHSCPAVWAILETVCAAAKTAHRTGAQHRIRNTVASPLPMLHRGNIGGCIDATVFVHQAVELPIFQHRFQSFEITAFTIRRITASTCDVFSHSHHRPFVLRRSRNQTPPSDTYRSYHIQRIRILHRYTMCCVRCSPGNVQHHQHRRKEID